jgi:integrase
MSRRRGKGEGSITQRSDGRWMALVDLGWQNGKRRRKAYYGRTRSDVAGKLTRALGKVQIGATLGDDRQTVGAFLTNWIDIVKPSIRPKTYGSYAQLIRLHLVPGLGHFRINKMQPEHVERFLRDKQDAGLSPRTCQYLRAVLRRALARAVKAELVGRNVAALADPPRVVRAETVSLTPEQARTFLAAIASHRLYPLVSVAVSLGLRQGEILGLRWSDVDLDQGVVRVRHGLQRFGKAGWRLVEPKSDKSRRAVKLPASLLPILRAHRKRQLEWRLAAGDKWAGQDFVFTTQIGRPLEGCRLNRDTKRLLVKAGLPPLHFHSLRHSCATLLLVQGIPPRVVMEILGHSDIRLTMNTYSHVTQQLHDVAASQIDALVFAPSR